MNLKTIIYKNRLVIFLVSLIIVITIVNLQTCWKNHHTVRLNNVTVDTVPIPKPEWSALNSIPVGDTASILRISYQEKYGNRIEICCKVVFLNKTTGQYKLVAPWLENYIVEASNINSFEVKKIPSEQCTNR